MPNAEELPGFKVLEATVTWPVKALDPASVRMPLPMCSMEPLPEMALLEVKLSLREKVSVPLSYAEELYALRGHIDLVRKKLQGSTPNAEEFSA